jgi:hypothetical protein
MSKYKLLEVAKEQDFIDLGFEVFQNSEDNDPRDVYFELKNGYVIFFIDAWFEVTAVVEELGFIETLECDSLDALKSWIKDTNNILLDIEEYQEKFRKNEKP